LTTKSGTYLSEQRSDGVCEAFFASSSWRPLASLEIMFEFNRKLKICLPLDLFPHHSQAQDVKVCQGSLLGPAG
jgi:hypothetical protein